MPIIWETEARGTEAHSHVCLHTRLKASLGKRRLCRPSGESWTRAVKLQIGQCPLGTWQNARATEAVFERTGRDRRAWRAHPLHGHLDVSNDVTVTIQHASPLDRDTHTSVSGAATVWTALLPWPISSCLQLRESFCAHICHRS